MTYVHSLSPFAIQFTENFGIRWYGLAYLTGFFAGYMSIVMMSRRGRTLFLEDQIADFITYCAIGVLAGGRLGYAAFYAPELFTSFDGGFPYWGLLKVNEGGMASHGGIMGVMLVCLLYARANKMPVLHCMDLVTFGGAIGFCFGRIANFINGELFGREAPSNLSWAVKFPSEILLWLQKDFEKLNVLGPALDALKEFPGDYLPMPPPSGIWERITHFFSSAPRETVPVDSATWAQWMEAYSRDSGAFRHIHAGLEALITATQHKNAAVTAALAAVLTPRYPSQLIQSVLEGLLVFLVLCWIWRRPQKPGVIAGWFGFLYCFARIIGEQFRMPDAHIGFQLFGLTRGQWLSLVMISVAVVWLTLCYRRSVQKMGGWSPAQV